MVVLWILVAFGKSIADSLMERENVGMCVVRVFSTSGLPPAFLLMLFLLFPPLHHDRTLSDGAEESEDEEEEDSEEED